MATSTIDIDLDNVDDDGIAASQTPAGAGAVTLNGVLGTTLDYARIIAITSGSDISNRTFTITGTDAHGTTISETLTGPNNTTVVTTKFYKTISSITISGAAAGAITIGTIATTLVATSHIYPLNHKSSIPTTIAVDVTGTINYTVQETFAPITDSTSSAWFSLSAHTGKTADTVATGTVGATGLRVLVNSYSNGAELQLYVSQPSRVS